MEGLTDAQVKAFTEAFEVFDKENIGKIPTKELGNLMRALGQIPSEAEVKYWIGYHDKALLTLKEFLGLMARKLKDSEYEEDIKEAFKVFDKDGKGFVLVSDLKHIMKNIGEKVTDEEIADLLKEVETKKDGKVYLNDFLKLLKDSQALL
eukprot:TRINITY_DN1730_c0_g1_i1.p1 TRINITY_DN1730_c0_g1~~TRINITY_DN1730_c0_g1_i1.p1  ORF type:complete len:150 (-),score=49.93 TRINITY_DN1730_c0_g1_i1:76-525(-)